MKDSTYWKQRLQDIMKQLDVDDETLVKDMLDEYQLVLKDVKSKIYDFYDKYSKDNQLDYDEVIKKVRDTDLSDYVERANQYRRENEKNPELLKRINSQYSKSQISRLELLKLEIEFRMAQASNRQTDTFTDYLKKASEYVYKEMAEGNAIKTLNKRELKTILSAEWSGANYSTRIWRNNDLLANKLKDELVKASISGNNPRVTANKIRGVFGGTKATTERLVRTESTYVANATTAKRYEEMGVNSYTFSAHLDKRTSSICRQMNGKTFKLKDFQPGENAPAMHPNCRSSIVPSDSELSKYNKYLDKDMLDTLPDWKQPIKDEYYDVQSTIMNKRKKAPFHSDPDDVIMLLVNGESFQKRYYDSNGNPLKDIDYTNHGNSKEHPFVPHAHDWNENDRPAGRKLKDGEY